MAGIFQRYDVIEGPARTLAFDDGQVDTVSYRDPDTGIIQQRPIRITPEQQRQVEVDGWRRALASVEHRIKTFDPTDLFAWEEPLSAEQIERKRAGLDAERQTCLDKLDSLDKLAEHDATPPPKRRR